jgi:hypothetical protein
MSRELLQQALDALINGKKVRAGDGGTKYQPDLEDDAIAALGAELAKPEQVSGETSDGYHTFNELYEFRKAYNAALFNEWAASNKYSVHKSKRHFNGENCFGGGWFIVVAQLPDGQISNHYEMKDWDKFQLPETDKALFEYDNHTGADVLQRLFSLRQELAKPEHRFDTPDSHIVKWSIPVDPNDFGEPLEQPEQAPKLTDAGADTNMSRGLEPKGSGMVTLNQHGMRVDFYDAPPRKEWVGLTDEEILSAAEEVPITCIRQRDYDLHFAPIIQAKLKEKNGAT